MCVVRGGHFWQLGSIASLATETAGGVILVAFWSKHGLRSDLRVPNLKIFPGGACPQTPLVCSHPMAVPALNNNRNMPSYSKLPLRLSY